MLILKVKVNSPPSSGPRMIVCSCFAVNDRSLRRHAQEGASCVDEVGRRCGAGTGCGSCRVRIERIVREEADRREAESDSLAAK
jgi:bacterioferritin-associated ferredoxin